MNRLLAVLALALAALVGTEAALIGAARRRDRLASGLRPLWSAAPLSPEAAERVVLAPGDGAGPWEYVREDGVWRYPAYANAYVEPGKIDAVLQAILGAAGTVVGVGDPPERWGVGEPAGFRVKAAAAAGPSAAGGWPVDVWVGRGAPGRPGEEAYVRKADEDTVFHLHANPRSPVGPPVAPANVPLLDTRVLPAVTAGGPAVRVAWTGGAPGAPDSLVRVTIEPSSDAPGPGGMPEGPTYEWRAFTRGKRETAASQSCFDYVGFVGRLKWEEIVDPSGDAASGLAGGPRVTLVDEEGAAQTLVLGGKDARGRRYVRNETTGLVMTITTTKADLLFPGRASLMQAPVGESPFRQAEPFGPFRL